MVNNCCEPRQRKEGEKCARTAMEKRRATASSIIVNKRTRWLSRPSAGTYRLLAKANPLVTGNMTRLIIIFDESFSLWRRRVRQLFGINCALSLSLSLSLSPLAPFETNWLTTRSAVSPVDARSTVDEASHRTLSPAVPRTASFSCLIVQRGGYNGQYIYIYICFSIIAPVKAQS